MVTQAINRKPSAIRARIRCESRAAELSQQWAFLCRRYNVTIEVAAQRMPSFSLYFGPMNKGTIKVNAMLSDEAQQVEIAKGFDFVHEFIADPEAHFKQIYRLMGMK
jgi:hypothetical protein